tara:strand:- start:962 stop:1486 length:525 start_codon:yes stop_codon:yes gene_type:complete
MWKDVLKIRKWKPDITLVDEHKYKDNNSNKEFGYIYVNEEYEHKVFVRAHYLESGKLPNRNAAPNTGEMENWIKLIIDAIGWAKGTYWFYRNAKPRDRQHIMVDIVGEGEIITGTNLEAPKDTIVFNTISEFNATKPSKATFLDLWNTGEKEAHRPRGRDRRNYDDEPPNPFKS